VVRNLQRHKKVSTWHAPCNVHRAQSFTLMTASLQHHVRRAGACYQQAQQRCVAMRPVISISVWNKTGAGDQN